MSKKKLITTQLTDNVYVVSLAANQSPTTKVDSSKGIIKWGDKNDYPEYLIYLYLNCSAHGAIINGKARYLTGVSIKPKEQNPKAEQWLKSIDAYNLNKRLDLDECISGNEYILVNSNILGQPLEFIHLDFAKCRMSECMNYVEYSENWSEYMKNKPIPFPLWKEGMVESAVIVRRRYTPSSKKTDMAYGKPEWMGATLAIDTDIEVSTFFNALPKNNFSAGTIVTIFSGKIKDEQKQDIKNRLLKEHAGTDNAGSTVLSFTNEGGKGAEVASLNANDLDKQYQEIAKRNREEILLGHGVPAVLFKQQTPGLLGQRTEMIEAQELFINEYVKPKQQNRLKWYSDMYRLRFGEECEFVIEQVENIGRELPLDNQAVVTALNTKNPQIITDYIIEKYCVKIPEVLDANGQPVIAPVQQAQVNDNLKGLTASENADILRIIRDHAKGRPGMNDVMAIHRLESYGIGTDKAKEMLGISDAVHQHVHLSGDQNVFFSLFEKYAHDINFEDEELESKVYQSVHFAEDMPTDEVKNAVLEALKENPKLTQEELANEIKLSPVVVGVAVAWLIAKKLLEQSGGNLTPTNKAFKTEIYTEYTYELAPGISYANNPNRISDKLLSTSHQFCKDMVRLTSTKALSFEAIDKMNNDFGENAFDFRGGVTTKPGGEKKDWCNHVWYGKTKIRKVKV